MQIFLVKGYLDVAATSLADARLLIAAMANPGTPTNAATIANVTGKLETLVQNDTGEPVSVCSIDDAAGTISSWVTDVGTSVVLGVGERNAGGSATYAQILAMGISGSARVGFLALNTIQLTQRMGRGNCCGRGFVRLTLQVRKTDADGSETMGLLPVNVSEGVLSSSPVDMATVSGLLIIGPTESLQASTDAALSLNITPISQLHTAVVSVTGTTATRSLVVLFPAGLAFGAPIKLLVKFPLGATDGTIVNIYDRVNDPGNLLFSIYRADGMPNALFQMYASGTGAIMPLVSIAPAFAV